MEEKMLYKDASQPVEARVEDLLTRMIIRRKAAQLMRRSGSILYCRW